MRVNMETFNLYTHYEFILKNLRVSKYPSCICMYTYSDVYMHVHASYLYVCIRVLCGITHCVRERSRTCACVCVYVCVFVHKYVFFLFYFILKLKLKQRHYTNTLNVREWQILLKEY